MAIRTARVLEPAHFLLVRLVVQQPKKSSTQDVDARTVDYGDRIPVRVELCKRIGDGVVGPCA